MFEKHWFWFWIVGLAVVSGAVVFSWISRETRLERRRRKSHSRIISKTNRPTVKFSVEVPKEKRVSRKKK